MQQSLPTHADAGALYTIAMAISYIGLDRKFNQIYTISFSSITLKFEYCLFGYQVIFPKFRNLILSTFLLWKLINARLISL